MSDSRRLAVRSAAAFGRVAVMMGGSSSEREISLKSGAAVLDALRSMQVDALAWDPAERAITELPASGIDRVWIALHGSGGEDGSLQGALEWLDMPYTGSGVMASALAMDKLRSKRLFMACGIPTPEFAVARDAVDAGEAARTLGYPLVVKPVNEGSSVGMSRVDDEGGLDAAISLALRYGEMAIIERCITGDELTVAVLQGEALPSIRIETPRVFYDYRAKYESDSTSYHCPGMRSETAEAMLDELAVQAFDALGCSGWGRADFMVDASGQPWLLEVNTVPGMTSHSLVPMAAATRGIDFSELCWRILETSMSSHHDSREVVNGA